MRDMAEAHADNFAPNQLDALPLRLGQLQELLDCHQRRGRAHVFILLRASPPTGFCGNQLFDLH